MFLREHYRADQQTHSRESSKPVSFGREQRQSNNQPANEWLGDLTVVLSMCGYIPTHRLRLNSTMTTGSIAEQQQIDRLLTETSSKCCVEESLIVCPYLRLRPTHSGEEMVRKTHRLTGVHSK
jgi:hypothetical protein